ncbi:carotenogenesis protein CarR [Myxococcus xanthus DK 1622]|uniref:Carotenogenesis protein CarR n=2 Tax=Myxococcus xanthus TaxID=34 RepID=CARR_MYXXA|nr:MULTISPECIES: carotenogenesis protein CarR [Myxococcus]Q06910.1 RecName: Full=Carotenogenesis protein CarR [Myxococcus xanthus]ABF88965.1 carotenogenesis protein CarR [Myxococcus xanthus DK 1622]NOJ51486.1 carotenogenesis protein CarR [Myxococcus xanthus]QPM76705.1 carotenogenesis protein CarR [Myxococcus xanthus]QVW65770.1 carotenogenesis protein CarR [Myxococcus xanthus DZ2]QZZ51778.1 Carotenogenesis protein CarR [Myxococcus xanthus]
MKPPMDLDSLLTQTPAKDNAALERVLAAARGELALRRPVRRWRTQAVGLMAASAGLGLLAAVVLLAVGAVTGPLLLARAPLLAMLVGTSAVCAWGALSPKGRWMRRLGVGLAVVSAAALVLARGAPHSPPSFPGWVCTVSHLAIGVVPLVVALFALRGAFFQPLRAVVAGLSVGSTGALLGELACEQDWRHVLSHHLLAWVVITVVLVVISKSLKPRSYAP